MRPARRAFTNRRGSATADRSWRNIPTLPRFSRTLPGRSSPPRLPGVPTQPQTARPCRLRWRNNSPSSCNRSRSSRRTSCPLTRSRRAAPVSRRPGGSESSSGQASRNAPRNCRAAGPWMRRPTKIRAPPPKPTTRSRTTKTSPGPGCQPRRGPPPGRPRPGGSSARSWRGGSARRRSGSRWSCWVTVSGTWAGVRRSGPGWATGGREATCLNSPS